MANFTFLFTITITFIFSFTSIFLHSEAYKKCPNIGGPDIRFPFDTKGERQAHPKTDSAFELLCKEDTTTIHFQSYGDLVVKSISYDAERLDLADPKSCVHEVFLNLNLSNTPFRYYYRVKSYTYLNCSAKLSPGFEEIPCLSGSGRNYVYTVEPSMDVPESCKPIKTVDIPFRYSPYLADNSFGLRLTWGFLEDQDCHGKEGPCGLRVHNGGFRMGLVQAIYVSKSVTSVEKYWIIVVCVLMHAVLSVGVFVFAVAFAFLVIKMIYHSRKPVCQMESGNDQVENIEKCLGEYQVFVSDEAYAGKVGDRC